MQAQQYRMPPEEYVRRIQEAGQLGAIFADVRRTKALIARSGGDRHRRLRRRASICPTCSASTDGRAEARTADDVDGRGRRARPPRRRTPTEDAEAAEDAEPGPTADAADAGADPDQLRRPSGQHAHSEHPVRTRRAAPARPRRVGTPRTTHAS